MERNKRGKVLQSDTRRIVYNVIKYFEEEKNMGRYHPLQYSNLRAAMATGLSKNTISRIKKEGDIAQQQGTRIKTPTKGKRGLKNTRVPVDSFTIAGIRGIISNISHVQKEDPTLNKILAKAKNDLGYAGSKTTLRHLLKNKIGFYFKRCEKNKAVLLEQSKIKAWRAKYLHRIRLNNALGDNKKPVIYLGETWIHKQYTESKCWKTKTQKSNNTGQRWIIIHAGSENGFIGSTVLIFMTKSIKGDYHDEINGEYFTKYIKDILIPNIPPDSIVVMDNTLYHSTEINKAPSEANHIADIQNWLIRNGIHYKDSWSKCELLELVKKYKPDETVDSLLADHGHEIIRLPLYNCDLNPIVYVWTLMKQRMVEQNHDQPDTSIEELTRKSIALVTTEDWRKEVNRVKKIEELYWTSDVSSEDDGKSSIVNIGTSLLLNNDSGSDSSLDSEEDALSGNEEVVNICGESHSSEKSNFWFVSVN